MTDIHLNGGNHNPINRYRKIELIRFVLIILIVFLLGAMTALFFGPYFVTHSMK